MRKLALAGLISAVGASFGAAQANAIIPSGVTLRLGGAFTVDGRYRDFAKTLVGLGVDYNIRQSANHSQDIFVSGEWFFKNLEADGNVWPLCINLRRHGQTNLFRKDANAYWFAGIGLFFFDIKGSSNNRLGIRAGYGCELNETNVLEFVGYASQKDRGNATAGSFGVFYGWKF